MKNPRIIASQIIQQVIDHGTSLTSALHIDHEQKPLIQQICYGVTRHYFELDAILSQLMTKPLRKKDRIIYYLLLVGIYQLRYLNIPTHAAVAETVACSNSLGKRWAKALVNAILRNYQRQQQNFQDIDSEQAHYNHPQWLIDCYKNDWPQHWQQILLANNQKAPMSLRVNQQKISREDYLSQLEKQQIAAEAHPIVASAIVLQQACTVTQLPLFAEGYVSVQDPAAQLASELLSPQPGQRLLDACCAPGGKSCHLLELQKNLSLTALDIDEARNLKTKENLARLQLKAQVISANAEDLSSWWDQRYYDCILLDAPCSATGVIRRHPDIKLLRRPSDLQQLQQTQENLLATLWQVLKPHGKLLYTTCSTMSAENDRVIANFLAQHPDAQQQKLMINAGMATKHGWQLLPGQQQMDGFYYCLLEKNKDCDAQDNNIM